MATKAVHKRSSKKRTKSRGSLLRHDSIPRSPLGREVQRQIARFGLSREAAAVVVGDAASQVSRLMTGHIREFSADRLAKMLIRLGSDVTISIRHAAKLGRRGKVRIKVG
jgi:predicted XRE-type DNA-binding protein